MRTGSELVRATKEYAQEDRRRSWRLLITTLLVQAAVVTATLLAPWWPLQLVGSFVIGLITVRLFIFFHDYEHGAIFKGSKAASWVMQLIGAFTLVPESVWKETHNYHHRNNAKLLGSAIGSFPVVTVSMFERMNWMQRLGYVFVRNPVTMALGHLFIFLIGMCLSPFRRNPGKHWSGPVVMLGWWGVFVALGFAVGWWEALVVYLLPSAVATAAGSYLFYAQHNFPEAEFTERREWSYNHAALKCSSMFEMSPLMHWFTGNIGYHHVHHLNHNIPFYRLPEAMEGMPELQDPYTTSWHPRDLWACLSLALFDPERGRLITYAEAREAVRGRKVAA